MKIKQGYKVRNIAGENVVIIQGRQGADMTRIITLNESALLLWNELCDRDFTADDAANILIEHYDVQPDTARQDAETWIERIKECNLTE